MCSRKAAQGVSPERHHQRLHLFRARGDEITRHHRIAINRTAQPPDAADHVDGRADHGKIEAASAADIAIKNLTDMKTEIDICRRKVFRVTLMVQDGKTRPHRHFRGKCCGAIILAVATSEDRQHAIADQFQHAAAMRVDRIDDETGVIIKKRDDLVRLGAIGNAGEIPKIGKPEDRFDPLDFSSCDRATHHLTTGITAKIDIRDRFDDAHAACRFNG